MALFLAGCAVLLSGFALARWSDRATHKGQRDYYDSGLPLPEQWWRALHDWRYLVSVGLCAVGIVIMGVAIGGLTV